MISYHTVLQKQGLSTLCLQSFICVFQNKTQDHESSKSHSETDIRERVRRDVANEKNVFRGGSGEHPLPNLLTACFFCLAERVWAEASLRLSIVLLILVQ